MKKAQVIVNEVTALINEANLDVIIGVEPAACRGYDDSITIKGDFPGDKVYYEVQLCGRSFAAHVYSGDEDSDDFGYTELGFFKTAAAATQKIISHIQQN